MRMKIAPWFLGLALIGIPLQSAAQTDVDVLPAELAAGFGSTNGEIVLIGVQLIFVDSDDPDSSFAISRSNIERVDRSQDVVTVNLRTPVRNQRQVMFRLSQPAGITSWFENANEGGTVSASADRGGDVLMTFQARHDHLVGGCVGRLMIMEDRLAFESLDQRNDSRQWVYSDISEIGQDGIYKLRIEPFLGNEYNLELVGRGLDSQQYRELADRIADARVR